MHIESTSNVYLPMIYREDNKALGVKWRFIRYFDCVNSFSIAAFFCKPVCVCVCWIYRVHLWLTVIPVLCGAEPQHLSSSMFMNWVVWLCRMCDELMTEEYSSQHDAMHFVLHCVACVCAHLCTVVANAYNMENCKVILICNKHQRSLKSWTLHLFKRM